jgi:hypothetical protein
MLEHSIWKDGEQIPVDKLTTVYRRAPEAPESFDRNTMVVGPRGAGKTVLLRYQARKHAGATLYVQLSIIFERMTKASGYGPFSTHIPPDRAALLDSSATSLLAARLARKAVQFRLDVPNLLQEYLPIAFLKPTFQRPPKQRIDSYYKALWMELQNLPLEAFKGVNVDGFQYYVSQIGRVFRNAGKDLLILMDRADVAAPPLFGPILRLLDQSANYVVVLAVRPGQSLYVSEHTREQVIPGDHFDMIHLGLRPRSTEWTTFVENAIEAQLGEQYAGIPPIVRSHVLLLARDSVRNALDIFTDYVRSPEVSRDAVLERSLERFQANLLKSASTIVHRFGLDLRSMADRLRQTAAGSNGSGRPINVSILPGRKQGNLFTDTGFELNAALQFAMRMGAVSMPEGERWFPGEPIRAFEIAPILAWRPGDYFWHPDNQPIEMTMSESQLTGRARAISPKPPSIFVAYDFGSKPSREFRELIEVQIRAHPKLSQFQVVDGRLPAGVRDWAGVVRQRIKDSKLFIADVTSLRKEVMFEFGLAYGLNKLSIPVVHESKDFDQMPYWLKRGQVGRYGSSHHVNQVLSAAVALLTEPRFGLGDPAPKGVPSLAVWFRGPADPELEVQQFVHAAEHYDLVYEVLSPEEPDEKIINRAAAAGLLCLSLASTQQDTFAHYLAGAVVAKPHAQGLPRRVFVIERVQGSIADSLRRCPPTTTLIRPSDIVDRVHQYGAAYRAWTHSEEGAP